MSDALVLDVVLAGVAALSAGFAAWQAYEARRSRVEARSAAEDSTRMVAALEAQAVAQQELVKQGATGDWSPLEHRDGDLYVTMNTSGRGLRVFQIVAEPEAASSLVRSRAELPVLVPNGGQLQLLISRRFGLSVESVKLTWVTGKTEIGEIVFYL
ncbi:hypothetical protein [Leucobacter ruminantium]|uniref:Uncharacterized protein n=1 Tax=Leucobacter ruminantium TaxID=1289170 RepID=A0A939LW42_9MICO|nr:hypothetical protein [Leucobacter ruminantium]MBO1805849.1 hypothetical protein [Leucobacter ruminantium]